MRLWFGLAMLSVGGAAMFACSSSSGTSTSATTGEPTGTGGTTSTTTTTTTSTGGSTTTSTTGTGGAGGGGMCTKGPDCQMCCINSNMAAAQVFEGYELKECGCPMGSPCESSCMTECMDPSKLMMGTPCGDCLIMQANMGTGSMCTVKAGLTDCANDPMCSPFITCITGHCL